MNFVQRSCAFDQGFDLSIFRIIARAKLKGIHKMDLDQARFNMVEQQIRPWDVLDPKVLELIADMPRHEFVIPEQRKLAYSDVELPLDENQFMLSPKIEARILQALDIDRDDTVLEVGTGSGYMTALLAALAQSVTSVEIFETLLAQAKTRLTHIRNVEFAVGDASKDWLNNRQYDAIVLTGSCGETPEAYKNKLNLGGRLFAFIGSSPVTPAMLITRISETEWIEESLFETYVPPLINAEAKPSFSL